MTVLMQIINGSEQATPASGAKVPDNKAGIRIISLHLAVSINAHYMNFYKRDSESILGNG